MKTFFILGAVLLALVGVVWLVRRKGAAPAGKPHAAPPKSTATKLENLSSAGCQAAAGIVGAKGSAVATVCKYTPFNIALKAAPPVIHAAEAVGSTTKNVVVGGAKGIVGGAKAVGGAVSHVFSSIF